MNENNNKIKIVTHDNKFHADDVFACATLSLYYEKEGKSFEIVRTRNMEIIKKADIVVDVGAEHDADRNRFDHHQVGKAGTRDDIIPYSSCGLVWKKYGKFLCSHEEVFKKIDKDIFEPIDAQDNGVVITENKFDGLYPFAIPQIINSYNPIWDSEEQYDTQFLKAVEFAKTFLAREISIKESKLNAGKLVKQAYENSADKKLVIFEKSIPWKGSMSDLPEALFVIFPREDGRYIIHAVPKGDPEEMVYRKYLPAEWGGLRDEQLQKVTGVADATFCHNDRFIGGAGTLEGTIKLAKLAIEK